MVKGFEIIHNLWGTHARGNCFKVFNYFYINIIEIHERSIKYKLENEECCIGVWKIKKLKS